MEIEEALEIVAETDAGDIAGILDSLRRGLILMPFEREYVTALLTTMLHEFGERTDVGEEILEIFRDVRIAERAGEPDGD